MYQTAVAGTLARLAQLHDEANALSGKGMCADDFAYYAGRIAATEAQLVYLGQLQARADAALEDAPCEACADLRRRTQDADRLADSERAYCSEACWEIGTAPGYFNARTQRARRVPTLAEARAAAYEEATRVTGEGYTDHEAPGQPDF